MVLRPPVEPMLAQAVEAVPGPFVTGSGLAFEQKFDGFRALLFTPPGRGGRMLLQTRRGSLIQLRVRGRGGMVRVPKFSPSRPTGTLPPVNGLRVGAWVVAGGLVFGTLALIGGRWALNGGLYGCTAADAALRDPMAAQVRALGTPQGAQADEASYSGCDDDDAFAYAGREYTEPARRADVVAYYRTATAQNGWLPAPPEPDEPAGRNDPDGERIGLCFTKRIDGATSHLGVSWAFDGEQGYTVEARASRSGSSWCP
ncbi:hypothetical protein [Streptomyces sp. NPDC058674]|uniref:hypothetical protein n=1 Tax=Streptomyces sp. NPDC058674 TaxID=3346592 RepID=UPI00364DAC02